MLILPAKFLEKYKAGSKEQNSRKTNEISEKWLSEIVISFFFIAKIDILQKNSHKQHMAIGKNLKGLRYSNRAVSVL